MSEDTSDGLDDFPVEEVDIDSSVSSEVQLAALKAERRFATFGLFAGLLLCVAGVLLVVLGSTGTVEIALGAGKDGAKIVTDSLGVVLAFLGVFLAWRLRLRYRIRPGK
jgi:hypothetical protein